MTIYIVTGFVGTSVVGGWFVHPRWTRRWLMFVAGPLVVLAMLYIVQGRRVEIVRPGVPDAVFGAAMVLMWLMMTPIGDTLIARVRAMREPRFRFDRAIHLAVKPMGQLLRIRPSNRGLGWAESLAESRLYALDKLEALEAPTADWSDVRDRCVRLIRDELEATNRGMTPAEADSFEVRTQAIMERILELRAEYGSHPRSSR